MMHGDGVQVEEQICLGRRRLTRSGGCPLHTLSGVNCRPSPPPSKWSLTLPDPFGILHNLFVVNGKKEQGQIGALMLIT